MQRKASARWQGTVKEGQGTISTQSGALKDAPYGFNARFADGKGTNPEELLGAAHVTTRARVPKIDAAKFAEIAGGTKASCPMSRVLNATITMDAKLVG